MWVGWLSGLHTRPTPPTPPLPLPSDSSLASVALASPIASPLANSASASPPPPSPFALWFLLSLQPYRLSSPSRHLSCWPSSPLRFALSSPSCFGSLPSSSSVPSSSSLPTSSPPSASSSVRSSSRYVALSSPWTPLTQCMRTLLIHQMVQKRGAHKRRNAPPSATRQTAGRRGAGCGWWAAGRRAGRW